MSLHFTSRHNCNYFAIYTVACKLKCYAFLSHTTATSVIYIVTGKGLNIEMCIINFYVKLYDQFLRKFRLKCKFKSFKVFFENSGKKFSKCL